MKQNRFGIKFKYTVKMQSQSKCGSDFLNQKQLNMVLFENGRGFEGLAQGCCPNGDTGPVQTGNTIGNIIGNTIGNSIGNTIGNIINKYML